MNYISEDGSDGDNSSITAPHDDSYPDLIEGNDLIEQAIHDSDDKKVMISLETESIPIFISDWQKDVYWGSDDESNSDKETSKSIYPDSAKAERFCLHQKKSENFMMVESEDEEGNVTVRCVPQANQNACIGIDTFDSVIIRPGCGPMGREWMKDVVWHENQKVRPPELVLSEADSKMFFNRERTARPVLLLKAAGEGGREISTVLTDRQIKLRMAEEKNKRLISAARATGFNYSADTMVKGLTTDRTMRPVEIPPPIHPPPANEKMLLRVPLPDEVRGFHRPNITRLFIPGKRVLLKAFNVKSGSGQMEMATLRGGRTMSAIRREKDLVPLEPHSKFILIEYIEERPPLLCSMGMASRFINWWRSSKGGNKEDKRTDRLETQAAFGAEGVEKPPECVDGQPHRLEPQEESPFMGEIKPGVVQSSLCNELFRVPLFGHQPRDTDFLLIREPSKASSGESVSGPKITFEASNKGHVSLGKKNFVMVIREIPRVYLAGQMEPQKEVFIPSSPEARSFQRIYLAFQVARLFSSSAAKSGVSPAELRAHFRATGVSSEELHKMADNFAGMKTVGGRDIYFRRSFELELTTEREKLAQQFRLEDVCVWESMLQAHRRLKDIGLRTVTSAEAISEELVKLKARQDRLLGMVAELEEVRKFAANEVLVDKQGGLGRTMVGAARDKFRVLALDKLLGDLNKQLKELQHVRSVAQYILEELQLTPWALTNSFVHTHLKKEGSGMMRLTGVGDPSGIGEGFSFAQKPQETIAQYEPNLPQSFELDQLSLRKVTGTNADLRKLNMRELEKQLLDLGMEKEAVAHLKRWDRVQMISHMANLAVTHNTQDAASVSRFTRKPRKSTAGEKKQYRHNIQDIWDRQANALSLGPDEVNGYSEKQRTKPPAPAAAKKKEASTAEGDEEMEDFQFEDLFAEVQSEDTARKEQQRMADLIRQAPTTSSDVAQRDEEKELNALKKNLASEKTRHGGISAIPGISGTGVGEGVGMTPSAKYAKHMADLANNLGPLCPRRAIKRIDRRVHEDGTETITVRYDFNQDRLRRMETENARRGIRISQNKSPLAHFLPKPNPNQNIVDYDSLDDEAAQRAHKIKLTVMRKRIKDYQEGKKRKAEEDRNATKDIYKVPRFGSSHRRGVRSQQPHNMFIERLVKIVDILIGRQDSGPFLRPISKTSDSKAEWYPSYRAKIKHPMDLQTLKYNAQHFRYRTKEQFLADLRFIANNAIEFNGAEHHLAKSAVNIVEDGRLQVEAISKELDEMITKFEVSGTNSRGKGSRAGGGLIKKRQERAKRGTKRVEKGTLGGSLEPPGLSSILPAGPEKAVARPLTSASEDEPNVEDNLEKSINSGTSSGSSGDEDDVEGGMVYK